MKFKITKYVIVGLLLTASITLFTQEKISDEITVQAVPPIDINKDEISITTNDKILSSTPIIPETELKKESEVETETTNEIETESSSEVTEEEPEEIILPEDTYINKKYVEYAREIIQKYPNLKLSLVIAVIECESSGRPEVVSKAGAIGLMQIIPKWSKDRMQKYGVTSLYDPYSNILIGCDILSEYLEEFDGDYYATLMRYNGTSNPKQKSKEGNYSKYSIKVVNRAKELEIIYN